MKRYKLISCSIFTRGISWLLYNNPHSILPVYLDLGAHDEPKKLRAMIQAEINNTDKTEYDAILLAYGLCGNSLEGVYSETHPLIIPKAHDCCTILLGSRKAFTTHFSDNLSAHGAVTVIWRVINLISMQGKREKYTALIKAMKNW